MSKNSLKISSFWAALFSILVLTLSVLSQQNKDIKSQAQQFVTTGNSRLQDNNSKLIEPHSLPIEYYSLLLERYSLLRDLAPAALAAGDSKQAKKYALELQTVGDQIRKESKIDTRIPSYATHVSNIVLGLIAFDEGNITKAKDYLLAAAQFSGGPDPALMTWGPNMLLAKKLLERGERETVIQYFDSCAKFWERENGRLEKWKNTVKEGGMPDFGTNVGFAVDTWRFRQL